MSGEACNPFEGEESKRDGWREKLHADLVRGVPLKTVWEWAVPSRSDVNNRGPRVCNSRERISLAE